MLLKTQPGMYFSDDFVQFFQQLAENNHKEWFDANRQRYEQQVKEPFRSFVQKLITLIQPHEPELNMKASEAIFRINRDIRFSKDKTPYKLHAGAYISVRGKKDYTWPGFYIQLSHEGVLIASGVYMPDRETLADIRDYIGGHLQEFRNLYLEKDFLTHFGSIKGDQQKRIPAELKEAAQEEPLLYNKNFYYEVILPISYITREDLPEVVMGYYRAAIGLNGFFKKVLE
jgi:uncharacterized protein (TIGR02453 family)